jgi:hypothetical protein
MATTALTPKSNASSVTLSSTGSALDVTDGAARVSNYPFGIYADATNAFYDINFISGASDQVAFTYKKLGGDILDIELKEVNVYAAYEESVLEYSYIVNIHQAKNMLPNALGNTTGTFDHDGALLSGDLSSSLDGDHVNMKFPKYDIVYPRRVADGVSEEVGAGGLKTEYSASIDTEDKKQDYDLQDIISKKDEFKSIVGNKKVIIKKVFFKTPHAMWRFFGYFGGMNSVGNLSTYGMFADDSTFEVIPPWQNKMQAMAYEDAIYTRNSHYSYEIKNNKLRIYPTPTSVSPKSLWVRFSVQKDAWDDEPGKEVGTSGVNNMNTLPFANIPFKNINSIGKQWIRRFAFSLVKETLGQVRGKFGVIPIPGESVTLNAEQLLSQAKEEQEKLREELKTILDELTYDKLAQINADTMDATNKVLQSVPYGVYVG